MKRQKKKINRFKEKFGICEIVYKVILEDHQFNKTGKHLERLQVDMTQAPHALKYAGYDFDKNLLTHLFADPAASIRVFWQGQIGAAGFPARAGLWVQKFDPIVPGHVESAVKRA